MLRPHQERAKAQSLEVIKKLHICILEGATRSGKTLTALSIGKALGGEFLVLTTKKAMSGIIGDWELLGGGDEMTVINYESVHKLDLRNWGFIVLDECHSKISSYPKQSQTWKKVRQLFDLTKAKALLMSGTVAIESKAQLFHELTVTGRGPFNYRDFYSWWNQEGHYKDGRKCGGYGIEGAVKKVGSNGPSWGGGDGVTDYSSVDESRVLDAISSYVVKMEREGYAVKDATLVKVELENKALVKLIRKIKKDKVAEVVDSEGIARMVCYDKGAAQVLQACHMLAGGTLIDVDGEAFVLGDEYGSSYRIDWIIEGTRGNGKQYAIFTQYVAERCFIRGKLLEAGLRVFDDFNEMRDNGGAGYWVGSLASNAEGLDLHWLSGSQILYSLTWSGSKFSQVCDRMLNFNRKEKAKVAIPILKDGLDSYVYEAVSNKRNFNGKVL